MSFDFVSHWWIQWIFLFRRENDKFVWCFSCELIHIVNENFLIKFVLYSCSLNHYVPIEKGYFWDFCNHLFHNNYLIYAFLSLYLYCLIQNDVKLEFIMQPNTSATYFSRIITASMFLIINNKNWNSRIWKYEIYAIKLPCECGTIFQKWNFTHRYMEIAVLQNFYVPTGIEMRITIWSL